MTSGRRATVLGFLGLFTSFVGSVVACADDETRAASELQPTGVPLACFRGSIYCGGVCTDVQTSARHCGACGQACAVGVACVAGKCASTPTTCGPPNTLCATTDGLACANLQRDRDNCGTCGNRCLGVQVCSPGICSATCAAPESYCLDGNGRPHCANLDTDNANCGSCGNACSADASCSGKICKRNLVTRSAFPASGGASCTTLASNSGRKVAVSPDHTIYVAMRCVNAVFIAKSVDGGVSFGAAVPTGITGQGTAISQSDVSIAVNTAGNVFLAATTTGGQLLLTRSTDDGDTWSTPLVLDTGMDGAWGAHLTVNGNNVFVSAKRAATKQTHLFRNASLGIGLFEMTAIPFTTNSSGDVVVDPSNGNVWAVADNNGAAVIRRSSNSGVSFGDPVFPAATISHSTWAAGGSTLFGAGSGGTEGAIWLFQSANPAMFTKVTSVVSSPAPGSRSISADALGNVYSAAVHVDGNVFIERVNANANAVTSSRIIGTAGSYPSVVAIDGDAAVVAFTSIDSVYVTVQKY